MSSKFQKITHKKGPPFAENDSSSSSSHSSSSSSLEKQRQTTSLSRSSKSTTIDSNAFNKLKEKADTALDMGRFADALNKYEKCKFLRF